MPRDDFDRFETPSYSGEEIEFDEGRGFPALGEIDIKKYAKYAIAAVIIVAASYLAYDFFIGSIQEISIEVRNLEGEPVSGNSIKITDAEGTKLFTGNGESTYTLKLKRGSYKINVIAQGYESLSKTITVPIEEGSFSATLRKMLNVEILGLGNFPETLFAGQQFTVPVQFKNNESHETEIEPVLEEDFSKFPGASFDSQKAIIPAGSVSALLLTFTVPASISIKDKTGGDDFKGSIKIKYTNISESVASKVFPALDLEISQTQISLSGDAGEVKEAKITVYNKNNFTVKDLVLEAEITLANKNDEVLQWLTFTSPPAVADEPYKVQVDEIAKKDKVNANLRIDIPLTAKKEIISGNIVLTAPVLLGQKIIKPLRIEVRNEAEVELEVKLSSYDFTPKWNPLLGVAGSYEAVEGYIDLQNRGEVALKDILVSVESTSEYVECDEDWLEFVNETEIDEIAPHKDERIYISVKAPLGAHETGETVSCKVNYRYRNPLDEAKWVEGQVSRPLAINPKN